MEEPRDSSRFSSGLQPSLQSFDFADAVGFWANRGFCAASLGGKGEKMIGALRGCNFEQRRDTA